ncbi:MAG: adenylyltransferase/cytidyltransferase family protein, partial [Planctomycetota bacterium]|nr:adenylyltransferase/cytidyltransferase family protein [Planctomycetota bacterium]
MDDDYQSKIVDGHALADAVAQVRTDGRSIVLCHGCFDIVHPGHIRYLEFARKHGDLLIVSITSDAAIDKESDRPYIPEELRAENLAALSFVDLVYVDPNHTAEQVLQLIKPDVYVKGHEYQLSRDPRFLAEQKAVEQYGGKVIFSSGDLVFSSTELIRRIGRDVDLEAQRLQYVTRRHDISLDTLESIIARFRQCRVVVV